MDLYREIGKGFCGSVWTAPNSQVALKRADGGPERSLLKDWNMHNKIEHSLREHMDVACHIPRAIQYVPSNDTAWWKEHSARLPPTFAHCNTLIADRIPPMPRSVRERFVDRYCAKQLAQIIKQNRADEDCLMRL